MSTHHNVCVSCGERLGEMMGAAKLGEKERAILEHAQRTISVAIPVTMDDGSVQVFHGVRVQYNDALGPTKGGIRYHSEVDEEEVKELAFLMTIKNSLAGLPYGGGKGGITCDPKRMSKGELEGLTRGYVRALGTTVGPHTDIPAPDVNTTAEMMGWFADEYAKIVGHAEPAVVTGKPIELGGSLGRDSATGMGGVFLLEAYAKEKGWKPGETTVAIQGFGNVGGWFALLAAERGYTVVAVSGSKGGVHNSNGFTREELSQAIEAKVLPSGDAITNEELLALPVSVVVPAALSGALHEGNAKEVKASLVIEMANAPTTIGADRLLHKRGIVVLPDILANAGGVTVSYFEWMQNLNNERWALDEVNAKLGEKMLAAYEAVAERARAHAEDLRTAAYRFAIDRVMLAEKGRGRV